MARRSSKSQRDAQRINALTEAFGNAISEHRALHETTPRKAQEASRDAQEALITALALEIWPNCEGDDCVEALTYVVNCLQARVTEIETAFQNEQFFPNGNDAAAFADYESDAMH